MKLVFRLLLIFLIILISYGASVNAQFLNWSTPVQLSSEKTSAWFPDIAADEFGGVHVVWSQAAGNFDNVMYTFSTDGKTWKPGNDIIAIQADRGSEATRPRLVANKFTSTLLLLYRYYQVFVAESPNLEAERASAWVNRGMLSDVSQVAYYSEQVLDEEGNLHALITWNVPTANCEICYHIFYRQLPKDSAEWSSPVDVSRLDIGTAKPSLLVDDLQNIHVIWEASDEGGGSYGSVRQPAYIMYSRSIDGGTTWSDPLRLGQEDGENRNPSFALDRRGQLVVVSPGLPTDEFFFQLSADGGENWSAPESIPGIIGGWDVYNTLLDRTSMAVDADGIIHLVLVGRLTGLAGSLQILHLAWDGIKWSEPDVIETYSGDAPEWPRIAISEGNKLNVVWFLRDAEHVWDTVNGNYTIWFSQLQTSATGIIPKIRPTRTPTPIVTEQPGIATPEGNQPAVEITITPTFIPSMTPAVPANYIPGENAFYKETDYLKLIAAAAVPAFLFLAIIVAIIFWRRSRHH